MWFSCASSSWEPRAGSVAASVRAWPRTAPRSRSWPAGRSASPTRRKEAGDGALAIECDVTDPASCAAAIEEAAAGLGGIDGLVYTPGIGPLVRLVDTDADLWRKVFDTNVMGASLVTAAALPHLQASSGTAVYLSSVSASQTPPWPGLGAYAVSKAALDKLVDAWRDEHPEVGFTRLVVGECAGGEGDSITGFADDWDADLAVAMVPTGWPGLHERRPDAGRAARGRRRDGPAQRRQRLHPHGDRRPRPVPRPRRRTAPTSSR